MEHKNYCYKQAILEITKSVDEMGNFEAYVAVFNNIDFGGDVILPNAFKPDSNKFYPLLADHNTTQAIGKFQVMPDSYGLKMVNASFNLTRDPLTNNFMVPLAAEKYANLKNGDISGFSIGYLENKVSKKQIDKKLIKVIEDGELMEGSVVTFPMNDKARLQSIKAVSPAKELPLAARDVNWDSNMAIENIREYTDSEEAPSSDYRNYFMFFDSANADNFGAYKLPFVDIIDDEPYIIPRAIFAIAGVLSGARGGVNIPDADKARIKSIINSLYARMAKEFNDDSLTSPLLGKSLAEIDNIREIEGVLKAKGFSKEEAKTIISKIKQISTRRDAEVEEVKGRDATDYSPISIKADEILKLFK